MDDLALRLNFIHRGNYVWCEVDGHLPGQFDHESRAFSEESRDSLSRGGHDRVSGCRGGN